MIYKNVQSMKPFIYYHPLLLDMYEYTTKYADLSDEELKKKFNSEIIPYLRKSPKVTDTLKYKGKLRISWALDVKYNKNIDLIFFTEDNPFINYAVLYAKDSPEIYKYLVDDEEDSLKRDDIGIPYDINYDFVKEVFKQSSLSPTQQEKFFNSRFGSVLIPMEIEFKWKSVEWYIYNYRNLSESNINKVLSFLKNDQCLSLAEDKPNASFPICLGIIKSYKVLPPDTSIIFPKEILDAESLENIERPTFDELLTPLPTSALAFTYTDIDDFIVNVRDKPSAKEGKILTQLLSQILSHEPIRPIFARIMLENNWEDWRAREFMFEEMENHYKTQQAYYEKEKSNLINPLNRDEYIVLVWNIESNGWAKVWILQMIDKNKNDISNLAYGFIRMIYGFKYKPVHDYVRNYKQMFLEQPSRFKLYEGYIHTSGLEYLAPFGENYIQR